MQPPSLIAASGVAAAANGLRMHIPKVIDLLHRITKIETVSIFYLFKKEKNIKSN